MATKKPSRMKALIVIGFFTLGTALIGKWALGIWLILIGLVLVSDLKEEKK